MKRAVIAVAAAFAIVAAPLAAFAQEGGAPPPPPPQQDIQLEIQQPAKLDAKALAKIADAAKARVPALITQTKITCTPTESRYVGSFNTTSNGKKVNFDAIEVSCSEGLGYMFAAFEKNGPVSAQDCIAQYSGRHGDKDPLVCQNAANLHLEKYVQPSLTKVGSPCQPTDIRMLGTTATGKIFEVACSSGLGELISVPNVATEKPTGMSCLAASGNLACKLTTADAVQASIKTLVTKADAKCSMEKQRYVMTTVEGDVIEVACTGGTGMMIVAKGGTYVSTVPCARAAGYSGGCQLSDVKAAQTEEAATYTQAARKAGFDCDVEKYGVFPAQGGGKEIVELACKNRPEGAVAIFSGSGDDQILNCQHSAVEGYRCSYRPVEAALPDLSKQLADSGKGSCVVNGARPIGVNKTNAYLEVSCADGNPGWVISYPRGVAKPNDVMSCAAAKVAGVGSCDLAANKKAAG
jgi:hypothetical protein